jgi:hypothetical protein
MLKLRTILTTALLFIFCSIALVRNGAAQETSIVKGLLLNETTNAPLPYANVAVLTKSGGTITNETGSFSIDISTLSKEDSLSFLFIGYATKNVSITDFKNNPTIYLKEAVFNLSEAFVFSEEKDPEQIIKRVLKNKGKNYKRMNKKNQVFIRSQYVTDINHFSMKFKKSSFAKLDNKMTQYIEKKVPKHSISYTDFLGELYFSEQKKDTLKIVPIKMVSLKEKDLADLEQLESIFEKMFKNTHEKEYWKVKSGIIGSEIELNDEAKNDSIKDPNSSKFQSRYYRESVNKKLNELINDKKKWEFLHSTSKYNYQLVGGTRFNGENVYIIDFDPNNKSGKYIGRVYIAMETYALVKADYEYAPGKNGTNIKLLGIGYFQNLFSNSVSYEKENGYYQLKYCSQKTGKKTTFNRNVSLLKKRKRFFWDKKLNEIKVRLNVSLNSEITSEFFVLSEEGISSTEYLQAKQPKYIKVIYVDQFDDKLWKGYSTIEPTKQMRAYKKQGL